MKYSYEDYKKILKKVLKYGVDDKLSIIIKKTNW